MGDIIFGAQPSGPTVGPTASIDLSKVDTLVAICLRNKDIYKTTAAKLKTEHLINISAVHQAAVWASLGRHCSQFKKMPPSASVLLASFKYVTQQGWFDLSDVEKASAKRLIRESFDDSSLGSKDRHDEHARISGSIVRDILSWNLAADTCRKLASPSSASDLPLLLARASQESKAIASFDTAPKTDLFPNESWEQSDDDIRSSTGVPFLDKMLYGGQRPEEVYLFMGPTGSCKTTLGTQLFVEQCRKCSTPNCYKIRQGKTPVAVYISLETPTKEFQARVLSYEARIPLSRMRKVMSLNDLRKKGQAPIDYERKVFKGNSDIVPEYDRARAAIRLVNNFGIFIDVIYGGGDDENGCDDVDHVIRLMQGQLDIRNAYPVCIIIDHLAAMVDTMMMQSGRSKEDRRALLSYLPRHFQQRLARHYKVPVWVIHQLSGKANSKSPFAKLDHTDGEECKTVAKYADFAIIASRPIKVEEARLVLFHTTKARHGETTDNYIIRLHGDLARLQDASKFYRMCESGRDILPTRFEMRSMNRGLIPDAGSGVFVQGRDSSEISFSSSSQLNWVQ